MIQTQILVLGCNFAGLGAAQKIREYAGDRVSDFTNGESLETKLNIVFPNWKPHAFMQGLPISDEVGFVIIVMGIKTRISIGN